MLNSLVKKVSLSTVLCTSLFAQQYAVPGNNNQQINNSYIGYNNSVLTSSLDSTVIDLANKLFNSSRINRSDMGDIVITSFVDLDKLNKTTHFGRTISESFFNELFVRGFKVTDFRGQDALSVNATGEFFITRDVNRLRSSVNNRYVLIGTYSMFEDKMLINTRILNNQSGEVVASARAYYHSDDCRLLENCKKPRTIKIVTDGCSIVSCPTPGCKVAPYGDKIQRYKRSIKIGSRKSKSDKLYATINHNNQNIMTQEIAQRSNRAVSLIQ